MSVISEKDIETAVGRAIGSSVRIVDHKLEAFSEHKTGFIGIHQILTVRVVDRSKSDEGPKSYTFFVKTPPDPSTFEEEGLTENIFKEEVFFYNELRPLMIEDSKVDRWSPNCYLGKSDILIFEDLRAQGFTLSRECVLDEKCLRAGLSALARFHASSILAEKRMGKTIKEAFPDSLKEMLYTSDKAGGVFIQVGFKTIASMAEMFALDSSLVPKIYDKVHSDIRPREAGFNVVCHGDLWKNNILFDDSDPPNCLLVDFQVAKYTSPVIDVGMFLHLHTTPDIRKSMEFDLFEHYYSTFRGVMLENESETLIPSYENMLKIYKESRLVAMTLAAVYLPFMYMKDSYVAGIMNDPVQWKAYFYNNRIDFVEPYTKIDHDYAKKIKDMMVELIEEAEKVLDK